MTLQYTQAQREYIHLAQEFGDRYLSPEIIKKYDQEGDCPVSLFKPAIKMGLHMLEIPKEYGGAGLSYEDSALVFEKIAEYDAGYALTLITSFVALRCVMLAGTEEQTREFARIIEDGKFAAFTMSEADAGSDAGSVKATAVRHGDEYILNGNKAFATNGGIADIFIGIFRTSDNGNHGLSAFMIDRHSPGIWVGKHEDKMGLRLSNTVPLGFKNVHVPAKNLLGKEGRGINIALNSLNLSRAYVSTLTVGIMQRALSEAAKYANERQQFNQPIAQFESVQNMLADMATAVETSRLLVNNTMKMMDNNLSVRQEGAMTKLFVTDTAQKVTSDAVQILGGYGYTRAYPVEKLMRDVKGFQILEGTNEIQRMTIAREVSKNYLG
ncbi:MULTISPECIES: acyl-CoA dehydrogenase family protein [unclassified Lactobacillus]|uniref:acyl-CoA dehydrogenase family protein n=1 Tax=unclassified Lactobacillus TaxID=2620435 RepID=UPI00226B2D64|nr:MULTISPECIES: acyl-CoA dehydrogenase family protein [unclassified Lactobacillus]MCT6806970.1 acyl-CoA dehydrogenase family protein [Bombilactobacillus sp.]MCT6853692.1 acyl-CoA dehydrogenase family protein [Lactobacillus panisapium]MCO6532335.1 acyl-CoA dehydrogenase family protein [Lactobacillus sp.]MCO6534052.1 acyl-CoA dehydrogenase family protein [Lactobacillus sp.]MCX8736325.1 acyl-CoA dehydrogenase family protein [Lactobacillus sp. B4026]